MKALQQELGGRYRIGPYFHERTRLAAVTVVELTLMCVFEPIASEADWQTIYPLAA